MEAQADAVKGRDELSDKQDETDMSFRIFSGVPERKKADTRTGKEDDEYNMNNTRRGDCHVFVYETYEDPRMPERKGADQDAQNCETAFEEIGFKVHVHKNLRKESFYKVLQNASKKDYSDCDALALVFMSHGDSKGNKEILHLYDGTVDTDDLWTSFIGSECPSLAGKPKLFFIQACRGGQVDKGVGMKVSTDSSSNQGKSSPSKYVIPAHADILVMWASFKGMYAFKTYRNGIQGSVFIHFLTKTLKEEGRQVSLADMLLKITRQVALVFESVTTEERLNHNKQVPQTTSSLMRKVFFAEMLPADSEKSS